MTTRLLLASLQAGGQAKAGDAMARQMASRGFGSQ
jgi:hypothetical protein